MAVTRAADCQLKDPRIQPNCPQGVLIKGEAKISKLSPNRIK